MMEPKEFLNACCGIAADGNSKSIINIRYAEMTHGNIKKDLRLLKEYTTYLPLIDIKFVNDFVYIDLIFKNKYERDLQEIWNILQDFKRRTESLEEESNKFPIVMVTIEPRNEQGKYIMASMPIQFPLCMADLSSNQLVISMLFQERDVVFEY